MIAFLLLAVINFKTIKTYQHRLVTARMYDLEMLYLLGNTVLIVIPAALCLFDWIEPYVLSVCGLNSVVSIIMAAKITRIRMDWIENEKKYN